MLALPNSNMLRRLAAPVLVLMCVSLQSHQVAAQKRPGVLTGKEKLAGKATDDQRVDNCKVPNDKRGAKIRPEECGPKQGSSEPKAE